MPDLPPMTPEAPEASLAGRLRDLAVLFFKLGAISFGGPAAHIALIDAEIVRRRQWVTRQQFLDMVDAANLIPGPASTELAINVGFARAGWMGLTVAGASFILPAALITGAFAWAYVRVGALPQTASVLAGIKAAVIAVIAIAIWRLGKTAVKDVGLTALGGLSLAAFSLNLNPIAILFGGGLVGMLARRLMLPRATAALFSWPMLLGRLFVSDAAGAPWTGFLGSTGAVAIPLGVAAQAATQPSLRSIALFFLKVGAELYGGGYVFAGLPGTRIGAPECMADASTVAGCGGDWAVYAGAGALDGNIHWIRPRRRAGRRRGYSGNFPASFFYVALLAPILFSLRQSAWMAAFLDSVNVCAVVLMAEVTIRLGSDALRAWPLWVTAATALGVLLRWNVNPAWVVPGGGLVGVLLAGFR
ncbi:MAG TPA: chromate transporter [Candidatus Sulfotelmatobacter sp.]|nr:chromate transporter [Candidatus Sulfotelmatobacter sp.]